MDGVQQSGTRTTVQTEAPWQPSQPFVARGMKAAQEDILEQPRPFQMTPEQMVPGLNQVQQDAINATIARARQGSPLTDQARQTVGQTAAGQYLGQNPMYDYLGGLARGGGGMGPGANQMRRISQLSAVGGPQARTLRSASAGRFLGTNPAQPMFSGMARTGGGMGAGTGMMRGAGQAPAMSGVGAGTIARGARGGFVGANPAQPMFGQVARGGFRGQNQGVQGLQNFAGQAGTMPQQGTDTLQQLQGPGPYQQNVGQQQLEQASTGTGPVRGEGVMGGFAGGRYVNQNQGQQYLQPTASGEMLTPDTNPYLSDAVKAATEDITEQYRESVVPDINAQAIRAGRTGSGAWADMRGNAQDELAQQLADTTSQMYQRAYEAERGRQMQAAQQVGAFEEQQRQRQLGAAGQLADVGLQRRGQQLTAGQAAQQGRLRELGMRGDVAGQLANLGFQGRGQQLQALGQLGQLQQGQAGQQLQAMGDLGQLYAQQRGRQQQMAQQAQALRQQQLGRQLAAGQGLQGAFQAQQQRRLGAMGNLGQLYAQQRGRQQQAANQLMAARERGLQRQLAGAQGLQNAYGNMLQRQLGAGRALGNVYQQERARQMGAAQFAPELAQRDYQNLQQMLQAASIPQQLQQRRAQAAQQRMLYNLREPMRRIGEYSNIVSGIGGLGARGTQAQPLYTNPTAQMLGGISTGASIGNQLGFEGSGLLGAGLGGLASL